MYNVAAMSAEPSPEPAVSPSSGEGLAAGPELAAVAGIPRTERALNSPTPLTLRLLGVVFLATFLPWVAAKLACNLREAPVRAPRSVPTDVLARQPKGAALELQQRVASGQYREAAELAKGELAQELLAAAERCDAEPAPCVALRAQSDAVFTRAVLVLRSPLHAEVRAESTVAGKAERYTLRVEPDQGRWVVVSRTPFSGELTEPAPAPAAPAPPLVPPAAPPAAVPPASPAATSEAQLK